MMWSWWRNWCGPELHWMIISIIYYIILCSISSSYKDRSREWGVRYINEIMLVFGLHMAHHFAYKQAKIPIIIIQSTIFSPLSFSLFWIPSPHSAFPVAITNLYSQPTTHPLQIVIFLTSKSWFYFFGW